MSKYEGEMIMKVNPYVDEEYRTEIKRLKDENEKLKEQIEKMKSCGNCKWCSNQCCIESFENPISHRGCEAYSRWELKE